MANRGVGRRRRALVGVRSARLHAYAASYPHAHAYCDAYPYAEAFADGATAEQIAVIDDIVARRYYGRG